MLNYHEQRLDEAGIRGNQKSLASHIDDDYNTIELGPGDFHDLAIGGAVTTYIRAGGSRYSVLSFPVAGATSSFAFATVRRRSLWVKGLLRCRLFYSGSTGSTNPAKFYATPKPLALGGLLSAVGANVSAGISGPAVANALCEYAYTSYIPVSAADKTIAVQLVRDKSDAADTYGGDFYVVMVLLEYLPTVTEA